MPALSSLIAAVEAKPDRSRLVDADVVIGASVLGALWFILCRHLSGEWSVNEQYAYGWFVPVLSVLLFWLRWEDRPGPESQKQKSRVPGFSLAIAWIFALFLLLPLRVFEIGNPDWRPLGWIHTAIVVGLTLLVIWTIGGPLYLRHFAFPVCFIFVAVPWISPIEQPLVQGLMRLVAAVATEALTLFGFPAQLEGNLIRVSNGLVGVNEACSGVRSLQTSIMIGLLFGEIKRLSILRRLVLVAGAIAIAMSANFLRAFFLVWIAASKGLVETRRWHDFAGYAIVALVFAGSVVLAAMLGGKKTQSSTGRKESQQQDSSASRISHRVPHSTFYVAGALVWILSVEVAAAGWYRAHEHGLEPTERWTVRWPQFEPGFREIQIDSGVQETLRFDKGREVTWHDAQIAPGQPTSCLLFFFRWEPGTSTILRARAHRPDICLPSAGWRQVADHGIASYPAGTNFSLPFRHFTFVRETIDNQRPLFADAFFCLGEDAVRDGQTSGSALLEPNRPSSWERKARWRVVRDGIRNPGQQVMQFIMVSPREMSSSKVEQRFAEFLPRLVTRVRNDSTAEQRDR